MSLDIGYNMQHGKKVKNLQGFITSNSRRVILLITICWNITPEILIYTKWKDLKLVYQIFIHWAGKKYLFIKSYISIIRK